MKKSAAKMLGAAAMGAAFAAAAAGTASATPAVGLTDALGTATGALQGLTSQQQVNADGQESSDPAAPVGELANALGPTLGGLPLNGALGG
ncbi:MULTISPECIES: hypothetical protein [Streptomyces]|jgi:hypothetical protein|uniref:ATP-binding protein n=3 Tax=Streptomyces TaxID=1883 RepID=A0A344TVI8_9ACTN|nr:MULTISPECIES: hypothetical protein [Streptomyces]AXE22659.1 hypothetical protein C0216_03665 [Streptomyces globosus]MBD3576405.1 hypothetical protein [Streptomyces sp. KD18]RSS85712.1 hypothetical protein EF903_20660 [Streptomyces sp. WAC05292]GGS88040.1 hypothetical protein GCM10010286_10960 [Streptomyces toxytricini]